MPGVAPDGWDPDQAIWRIDAAHPVRAPSPSPEDNGASREAAAPACAGHHGAAGEAWGPSPETAPRSAPQEDVLEQARIHAAQLARHLQERRREVDHREAHLNARIAQLESELRVSRMWVQARSEDFQRREAELEARLAEQESRLRGISATEISADDAWHGLREELQVKEGDLRRREDLLADRQRQLGVQEEQLRERLRQLEVQERICQERCESLQQQRDALEAEIAAARLEVSREVQEFGEQRRMFEEQQAQMRSTWEARQRQFDERQIALERIRHDISRAHREALEMRLVAEQLWTQLAGRAAPGDLTQGIAAVRSQLADEFRFAQEDLARRQSEVTEMVARLDAQRTELAGRREELVKWLGRRQRELSQQTRQLAERERQLRQEQRAWGKLEQQWLAERTELQRQVRQLTLQLRRPERTAA